MMLSAFNCCVSVIGCCGKCCSCCVVVFLSIYKFEILVFCFGGWFIGMYFCGRNSRGVKAWVWIVLLTNDEKIFFYIMCIVRARVEYKRRNIRSGEA